MANGRKAFRRNDFDYIYAKYFEKIVASGSAVADPSGWAQTETEVNIRLPPPPTSQTLSNYVIDNRKLIAPQKEVLISLLEKWDHQSYAFDEITITPSISTASLAVLLLLRSKGVDKILFETPAYYATVEQAAAIGIRTSLIPTYHRDQYTWNPTSLRRPKRGPTAIWLTQPRFALGLNQRREHVEAAFYRLGMGDFLVVDETADQLWPTSLSSIRLAQGLPSLIKIRGYAKPLGLNGLRLSFVIHSAMYRSALRDSLWVAGAALDYYSLAAAVQIAS